eukprot:jgi/Chrzof1/427/Cz01g15150.t1
MPLLRVIIAAHLVHVASLQAPLLCGFDFVVAPLVDPSYHRPALQKHDCPLVPPGTRTELMLTSAQWGGQIVGQTSDFINTDSLDPKTADVSCAALQQELSWAAFLGLQAVLVKAPQPPHKVIHFAQVVNQALGGLTHMAVWIQLPLTADVAPAQHTSADTNRAASVDDSHQQNATSNPSVSSAEEVYDSWDRWHEIITLCDRNNLLGAVLEVSANLPPARLIRRWLGQPLRAVVLPTDVFTTNKRGYPVLSKAHQELVAVCYKHGVQVVLSGDSHHKIAPTPGTHTSAPPPLPPPGNNNHGGDDAGSDQGVNFAIVNPGESHPLRPYWEYLCYLFRRLEDIGPQDIIETNYKDYLQAPLQPLQDNLESQTYETFEKDHTKYAMYQQAVYKALLDRVPDSDKETTTTVLMVVGAGRGPLVRSSIKAAEAAGRWLKVYAVEKNPSAVVHIQAMIDREGWTDKVKIVSADMRSWQPPELADILVSELLGSFGDNELSPECLDGAQRLLRDDGVSIPCDYTSYLAPVTTAKLHEAVRAYKDLEHLETPYVVKFHKYHQLSAPQPVFTFKHPNRDCPIDNSRRISITFPRTMEEGSGELHGFAGYFESTLYPGVILSTYPPTHTPNMFSWFPMYFPVREPMYLPAGESLQFHMWRLIGAHKVWYEWAVTAPSKIPIHNPGGRSYWVGL